MIGFATGYFVDLLTGAGLVDQVCFQAACRVLRCFVVAWC
jgi:hypothetical protein